MLENVRLNVSEILGVLVNTLTANNKYSLCNNRKLPHPVQLELSKKKEIFTQFFSAYLRSTSNFQHFERKDDPDRLYIFEIRDCPRCG